MATRLTIVKKFTYRGDPTEQFSNTYSLRGSTPVDGPAWVTLANLLIAQEKTVYPAMVKVIKAYCYNSDDPHAPNVYTHDISGAPVSGTLTVPDGVIAAGDAAVWVRWKTPRLTEKGKPIYLRKFFHGACPASAAAGLPWDSINGVQRTALLAFGTKLMDGTLATDRTITGPGFIEDMVSREASTVIGYRQLRKGRKRRPPP